MFNFFKKNRAGLLNDFSGLAVDLHSHLIPGIDDGAQTIEESVNLVVEMQKLGYKKLITTPHIMFDFYKNTPQVILSGLERLQLELKKNSIEVDVEAAAEYYYDEYFLNLLETEKMLTIHGEYLLFELSYINKPRGVRELIQRIQHKGYKPLLAHPERYSYLGWDDYMEYKRVGCYFQLNILSLTGFYGKYPQRTGRRLIDNEMIDFIASDLHRMQHAAQMKLALREKYLEKIINYEFLLNKTLI